MNTLIDKNDMIDKNDKQLKNGSIVDMHQTINGQSKFVVLGTEPLDVRYAIDLTMQYEYGTTSLFEPCPFSCRIEFEIIGNIYDMISEL